MHCSFRKASLDRRAGTAEQPIQFTAKQAGAISGQIPELFLENCRFTGLGAFEKEQPQVADKKKPRQRQHWLIIDGGEKGTSIRACSFDDCGQAIINSAGPITFQDCALHHVAVLAFGTPEKLELLSNTMQYGTLRFSRVGKSVLVRDNVIIQGTISGPTTDQPASDNVTIEFNYIHDPWLTSVFGLIGITENIRNNVVRGAPGPPATWAAISLTMCWKPCLERDRAFQSRGK